MMKKMKYSIVAVALIALLCAGTAYALITIWSEPMNVNLQYTVTMTGAPYTEYRKGEGMALCARVLDAYGHIVPGITVDFYASTTGSGGTYGYIITSEPSSAEGYCSVLWTGAGAYDYWFKAYVAI